MSFSIYPLSRFIGQLPVSRSRFLKRFSIASLALAACSVSPSYADAMLTYELTEADGAKAVKQFGVARFYARIDDPADQDRYLLYQAGKFFPLFAVDKAAGQYTRLTPEVTPFMSPQSREHHGADQKTEQGETKQTSETRAKSAPKLKPAKKNRKVAGIKCRVVHELEDDKPVVEHCMANSARLGITEREVITMVRTFEMGQNRDYGWLGIGTEDEEFISIYSRDLRDNRVLQLTEVSNKPLPADHLRVPREYKQAKSETPSAPETSTTP
jgi:hypothetical protein